jgi:PAS domain S-box-containing protein
MEPSTAVNFLLIGMAIILIPSNIKLLSALGDLLMIPVAIVSYFFIVIHLFEVSSVLIATPSDLFTNISFCLLSIAILFRKPNSFILQPFTAGNAGGTLSRTLLLPLLFLPLIIGWLRINGERAGVFNSENGIVLVTVAYTVSFIILTWRTSNAMNLVDLERKKALEKLQRSEEQFRDIAETIPVLISITSLQDRTILFTNEAFDNAFGYEKNAMLGKNPQALYYMPDDSMWVKEMLDKDTLSNIEVQVMRKDGTPFWVLASSTKLVYENTPAYLNSLIDITERKKSREELIQLNRTLNAHTKSSKLMMKLSSELQYLQDVCKIINDDCGYAMVWIGFALNDENKTVKPIVYSGFDKDYIEFMNISWADSERGRGPTGTAIREGRPVICKDIETDPLFEPWRHEALKRRYASSLVLPLNSDGKTIGAISLYSHEKNAFSQMEVELLLELANDLAYGLAYLRLVESEKKALASMKEKERMLEKAQEIAHVGSWEMDLRTNQLHWSDESYRIFGFQAQECSANYETFLSIVHPDDLQLVNNSYLASIENNLDHYELEHRVVQKNSGNIRFVHEKCDHIRDEKGVIIKSIGMVIDITERKKIELELKYAREKLELALDNGSIGIWEWDIVTGEIKWDERMHKIFGLLPDSFEGSYEAFEKLLYEEDITYTNNAVREALELDLPFEVIYRISQPDGGFKHITAKALVDRSAQGKAFRMTGVCFDVSELKKKTDETLFNLNEKLLRSNKELEQFAYVASHDLQEPLRMVSSFTQLLALRYKDKLDKQAHEFIHFAVDGAARMQGLINDLLQYSRIETRGKELMETEIREVIDQVLNNLSLKINEKKAVITTEIDMKIKTDKSQMIQLFQNLIDNALKFCHDDPKIRIFGEETAEHYLICISDNGIGIDPQYHERIFQVFQRLHQKELYGGTGIGLAICKRIVERHGGKIWIEANTEKGSTFKFTIKRS